jgi:hypothetical protein
MKHTMFAETSGGRPGARFYYHKGTGKNAAYAEPFVSAEGMDAWDVSALLTRVYDSWEAWRDEAVVLKAAHASKQDASLIKTAVKATKALPRLTNPDAKVDVTMSEDFGLELDQRLKVIGSAIEDLLQEGFMQKGTESDLEEDVDEGFGNQEAKEKRAIYERMNLLQRALVELNEKAVGGLKELQVGFGVRLSGLESIIGSFSSTESKRQQAGSSVLGLLEDLEDQVSQLKGMTHVNLLISKVFQSSEMMQQNNSVKEAFRAVMQRMVRLEEAVQDLRQEKGTNGMNGSTGGMDWLGQDIGMAPTNERAAQDVDTTTGGDVIKSLMNRLDGLEQTMMPGYKTDGEDIAVSFMGVRFSSEDDVRAYVETLCDGQFDVPPGLVTDCYALFHVLNREIFDGKNKLGVVDLAKVGSLNMAQSDVYNILAAAEHGLPDFFDPPSSSSKIFIDGKQGKKHRFSNISTYEIWGPVGTIKDAVRKRAETQLKRYVRTKQLDLKTIKHPDLRAFLTSMLELSKDFVEAVFSFLTEEYSALAQHFGDSNLCWDFACSCVEHVFKYEFEAARAVVNNPDVSDPLVKSKVLWQSLRTISVQESFMRVGFKNHSSLSSAYSRFLLTQYQQTAAELSKMTNELESNKRSFAEMKGTMDAMEKRVKAAEGTANAAQSAVQKFKKHHD